MNTEKSVSTGVSGFLCVGRIDDDARGRCGKPRFVRSSKSLGRVFGVRGDGSVHARHFIWNEQQIGPDRAPQIETSLRATAESASSSHG